MFKGKGRWKLENEREMKEVGPDGKEGDGEGGGELNRERGMEKK